MKTTSNGNRCYDKFVDVLETAATIISTFAIELQQ